MAHRSVGQEQLGFTAGSRGSSSLGEFDGLIDRKPIADYEAAIEHLIVFIAEWCSIACSPPAHQSGQDA